MGLLTILGRTKLFLSFQTYDEHVRDNKLAYLGRTNIVD